MGRIDLQVEIHGKCECKRDKLQIFDVFLYLTRII